MKRIALFVFASLVGLAVNAENIKSLEVPTESVQSSNKNTVRIQTRPEIVGLWGMQIDQKNKCVEYYNFKSNSNVVIKSGEEWSTGIYDYQPTLDPSSVLSALTLQVQYDNNEVDCSGVQKDQTGEVTQYYVKWKNPQTLTLCNSENSEECIATLRRVLP